jgi:transposase
VAKTQIEVITSIERRRRWSAAEKERLVAASLEPGASVLALAREAGLHPSQLYKWRRQLCVQQRMTPDFAAVRIIAEPATPGLPAPAGVIEIELAGGTRLRITGAVDTATVTATVGALVTKDRRS